MAEEPIFFAGPEHEPFTLGEGATGALLIHGFPGTPAELRPLGERLATNGFVASGMLLPGFGPDIARLGEMTRATWLDATSRAWAEVRAAHEKAVLIGYSMGGALALRLAAEAPPAALVLLAPFWRLEGWQFKLLPVLKHITRPFAPFQKADFNDPAVRAQLGGLAPDLDLGDPATQQFLREQVRLPLGVLDEVRRLGLEAYDVAPKVDTPTLILQGSRDTTVTAANTRQLAARLPGPTDYREVPGNHDFVRLTGGYDFTPDVVAFLAGGQ